MRMKLFIAFLVGIVLSSCLLFIGYQLKAEAEPAPKSHDAAKKCKTNGQDSGWGTLEVQTFPVLKKYAVAISCTFTEGKDTYSRVWVEACTAENPQLAVSWAYSKAQAERPKGGSWIADVKEITQ